MTNLELNRRIGALAKQEREVLAEMIALIATAMRQKTWVEFGYCDCYSWLTQAHGYSNGAAHRRICAAKLLTDMPEVKAKIESGDLQLSNLTTAQMAIGKEERRTGVKITPEKKWEVIASIGSKTAPEAQREIAKAFPELDLPSQESLKAIVDKWRLTIDLTQEEKDVLDRVRELLSHAEPNASWAKIIGRVLAEKVKRDDPIEKQKRAAARGVTPAGRTSIIAKAGGQCEHVHVQTGQRCQSRIRIELDHIRMRAHGGGDERENLRAYCRKHNVIAAEHALGFERANAWRTGWARCHNNSI